MKKLIVLLVLILIGTSCVSKKKILYLQDVQEKLPTERLEFPTIIKNNDLLRIYVSSQDPELVDGFNQFVNPTLRNELTATGNNGRLMGYLVDVEGNIQFPVIGEFHVSGKTVQEVTNQLESQLKKYVSDATVDIRLLNSKITVLGEVNNPGTFEISDQRITLLQALGLAGDLTIYGDRKEVTVLRDVNGVQEVYKVDLTNSDFINAKEYFLQQNDIVVVNPNKAQVQAAGFNRNASLFVSIASLLLSVIVILSRN